LSVRCLTAGHEAVMEAARIIAAGGIVAVPTDTVYGLGTDPSSDEAVANLIKAKEREAKPIPVLCSDLAVAERLVELNGLSRELAGQHWPGALTIVAPLAKAGGTRLSRLLDQESGYLGVRVPDSEVCHDLAVMVGGAITGTSANLSARPSCRTASQVIESLDGRVDLVLDGGRELTGKESTVVRVTGTSVEVLREGSVRIQEGESSKP
jgi:L-threonylcarbamoyladenylate synthase